MRVEPTQLDNQLFVTGHTNPKRARMPSTASISRTHSQCQRSEPNAPPRHRCRGTGFFISGKLDAGEPAERLHKQSPNPVKRLVEPIGIEPMTSSLQS